MRGGKCAAPSAQRWVTAEISMSAIGRSDGTNPLLFLWRGHQKGLFPTAVYVSRFPACREAGAGRASRRSGGLTGGEIRGQDSLWSSLRAYWRPRVWRTREGVVRACGAVFTVLIFVLLLAGAVFLYDAETQPLTANAAQMLIGCVAMAFSPLVIFFLVGQRR